MFDVQADCCLTGFYTKNNCNDNYYWAGLSQRKIIIMQLMYIMEAHSWLFNLSKWEYQVFSLAQSNSISRHQ